ncbi:MAG TPA: hypothetical protein VJ915_07930 [Balneolaceae bacterium]|nr:hypothetical protein [Balneolaceae bacterium]
MPAKTLFLIDAAGAFVTAILLSQVLARYESAFGMPGSVLFVLAGIALVFGVYSVLCHFLVEENTAKFLKVIAAANTMYCILTLGLMMMHASTLTWLGLAYFTGEIIIILMLVRLEYKTSQENH